mgnify:FL=1
MLRYDGRNTITAVLEKKEVNKGLKKGGCRVTAYAVPGMYYEKVYLNSMITSYRLYAFHLFDDFSIQKRCEERMINK